MRVHVGDSILQLWNESGAPSLFVVGTGKNVGKTVALRAIYGACVRGGVPCGLTSIGRDGEAFDVADTAAKPRLGRPAAVRRIPAPQRATRAAFRISSTSSSPASGDARRHPQPGRSRNAAAISKPRSN